MRKENLLESIDPNYKKIRKGPMADREQPHGYDKKFETFSRELTQVRVATKIMCLDLFHVHSLFHTVHLINLSEVI